MTREQALNSFFSGFGMPAYPTTSVPIETTFPYLTYETNGGYWGDSVSMAVNLWYHTESEAVPNEKVREISNAVGMGGKVLKYDGGRVWIARANPFVTPFSDELDHSFKRRQLLFTIEDWRI